MMRHCCRIEAYICRVRTVQAGACQSDTNTHYTLQLPREYRSNALCAVVCTLRQVDIASSLQGLTDGTKSAIDASGQVASSAQRSASNSLGRVSVPDVAVPDVSFLSDLHASICTARYG